MEIEKGETPLGYTTLEFADVFNTLCRLWVLKNANQLRLELNSDVAQFTQEQVQTLLPYLQSFAQTGTLEPQESTLQGEEERINAIAKASAKNVLELIESRQDELEKARKEKAYYLRRLDKQVDQIAELEDLVVEWRNLVVTQNILPTNKFHKLQDRTSQLLGE